MNDQQAATQWASDLMQQPFCILDTETTGLDAAAQICQIGVLHSDGYPLFDSYIKPTVPITAAAAAIHGITAELVSAAPSFLQASDAFLQAIGSLDVVIYNAHFDLRLIRQSAKAHGLELAVTTSDGTDRPIWVNGGSIHCAMLWYAQWVGEVNSHYGSYKWQKLPSGDHSAIGDCRATLAVIQRMAASDCPF